MTIYQATENEPVICLIGENRTYCIGDTAYRFQRQKPGTTLPLFALGIPVVWIEGNWTLSHTARTVMKQWSDKVTVIEPAQSANTEKVV